MPGIVVLHTAKSARRLSLVSLWSAAAILLATTPRSLASSFQRGDLLVRFRGDSAPFRKFTVSGAPTLEAAALRWSQRPDVVWAEPNDEMQICAAPDDPGYPLQWNLDNPVYGGIHAEEAWDLITSHGAIPGDGALVAVVDTGLAYEDTQRFARCPDFASERVAPGWNFVVRNSHADDDEGHGTHVAGTIAAGTGDGVGFAGIAYGARMLPIKVMDSKGRGSFDRIAMGIRYAADQHANIINLSLGSAKPSRAIEDAIQYAASRDALIVAAAGNNGRRKNFYPAAYDKFVVAVTSTRYDNSVAAYSNSGNFVDVAAPGGDPAVDLNQDGVRDFIFQLSFDRFPKSISPIGEAGTSMSCAHVSGVAALIVGLGITSPSAVRQILESSAQDEGPSGWDIRYGWGIVDAAAAVQSALAAP